VSQSAVAVGLEALKNSEWHLHHHNPQWLISL
jgi:hypothetical protein